MGDVIDGADLVDVERFALRRVTEMTYLGPVLPGERALPIRVVVGTTGVVLARCVALKTGAMPCGGEWPLAFTDGVMHNSQLENAVMEMIDHMRRYHAPSGV